MSSELEILRANVFACGQRIDKLGYSLNKNRALFPMTRQSISTLSDDQEESIDALILRYSQCGAKALRRRPLDYPLATLTAVPPTLTFIEPCPSSLESAT